MHSRCMMIKNETGITRGQLRHIQHTQNTMNINDMCESVLCQCCAWDILMLFALLLMLALYSRTLESRTDEEWVVVRNM